MMKTKLQLEIEENKHFLLSFYCKWKGVTIRDYILKKLEEDIELQQFEERTKELNFR